MNFSFKIPPLLLSLISGILLAVAVPPVNLYYLAWVGLIPLLIALEKPLKSGFSEGFVAGLVFNTGTLYWLAFNSGTYPVVAALTMFVLVVVISSFWGLAAWLFRRIYNHLGQISWIVVPFSWTAWEGWQSNMGELSFPWSVLALTQTAYEPALQIMEFTGMSGVTFWVVSLNVLVLFTLRKPIFVKRILLVGIVLWFVIPFGILQHSYKYYEGNPPITKLMAVQGSLDPLAKWKGGARHSWDVYDSLSREGFESGTEIIIWPETALPTVLIERSFYTNSISQLARELNTPIITGSSALRQFDDDLKPMNVAYLVSPDHGIEDVYSKQILVPFGERVPFQWIFPQLGNLNLGQAEFLPGLRQSIFEVKRELDTVRFSSLICYESIIPRQTRKAVKNGANLLVTISNDAWYGKTSEAHQIAALSRFRCIETRRSMVRASNTGISFLADPLGRIIRKTELLEPVSITGFLPLIEVETIYVKCGDWFLTVVSLIFGSILIYISVVKIRKPQ